MLPRDVAKLAFQFQQHSEIPFCFNASQEQQTGLTQWYGGEHWREKLPHYFSYLTGVDNFLSLAGYHTLPGGLDRDCLGCVWKMGSTHHLVEWPLKEPSLGNYRLPDIDAYFSKYVKPRWETELQQGTQSFRIIAHSFGLFERAWSLRGFESFCMDLHLNPRFCEEL
ncbi:MAG: hypothetical protein QME94_15230, partial [Anaerolineae bacterium]|nr:hypothetical protein [Anaerolineae bacterium]